MAHISYITDALLYLSQKVRERYELVRSATRRLSTSKLVISRSIILYVASCYVELECFLTAHL